MKNVFIVIIFIALNSCNSNFSKLEKELIGDWIQEPRSGDTLIWSFSKDKIVSLKLNNTNNGSFSYSIYKECPEECKNYQSKWDIDNYLFLRSIKDSSNTLCYEIIFEKNKDISIRYLPSEKDTYEILRSID